MSLDTLVLAEHAASEDDEQRSTPPWTEGGQRGEQATQQRKHRAEKDRNEND
jgi:hypothetical protein